MLRATVPADDSFGTALAPRPAPRCAFAYQALHERDAMRRDLARVDGLPDGAARLAIVAAVAKPAMPEQRTDLDERFRDRFGIDVREAEHLEPGRIDDPAAAVASRAADRAWTATSCAGRSNSASEIVRGLRLRVRRDGVQDRRLAHSGLADEDGALAAEQRAGAARRRVAPTSGRPRSRAPQTA